MKAEVVTAVVCLLDVICHGEQKKILLLVQRTENTSYNSSAFLCYESLMSERHCDGFASIPVKNS
jgi:hypothetical protein